MARKGHDLLAELDQLGGEGGVDTGDNAATTTNDGDPLADLADLQAQLSVKPVQNSSRPNTPRLSSSTTSAGTGKKAEHTPASSGPPSGRNSTENVNRVASTSNLRKSNENTRTYHTRLAPGDSIEDEMSFSASQPVANTGAGWWGSVFATATATASAAIKQADTLTKDLRNNQDASKWAEQVRALGGKNLSNLQSLSSDLRSRALPTFTSLLQHIAPPISAHERLQIHITHDILGYPSLDPLIYRTFERTMAQVEGGELMVIQRGSESRGKAQSRGDEKGYRGGMLSSGSGWSDGPWWRDDSLQRSLGTVPGLKEGTRLARVSAEAYSREHFEAHGGVEEAAKRATETLSEENPVRSSDIFLAIQAISYAQDKELFADDARAEKSTTVAEPDDDATENVLFAIYLHDPIHSITFSTLSQAFPAKWAEWLDASAGENAGEDALPESIREIIEAGGVDPREWVAEWMEEVLMLSVGVLAQRYVARRMGVGEGGIGRGKKRVEETTTAGEAARGL